MFIFVYFFCWDSPFYCWWPPEHFEKKCQGRNRRFSTKAYKGIFRPLTKLILRSSRGRMTRFAPCGDQAIIAPLSGQENPVSWVESRQVGAWSAVSVCESMHQNVPPPQATNELLAMNNAISHILLKGVGGGSWTAPEIPTSKHLTNGISIPRILRPHTDSAEFHQLLESPVIRFFLMPKTRGVDYILNFTIYYTSLYTKHAPCSSLRSKNENWYFYVWRRNCESSYHIK